MNWFTVTYCTAQLDLVDDRVRLTTIMFLAINARFAREMQ